MNLFQNLFFLEQYFSVFNKHPFRYSLQSFFRKKPQIKISTTIGASLEFILFIR
jgi:hypothetical protein